MESIFGRLLTAMVTPFGKDGRVDYYKGADLAEFLVEQGSEGLVVTGTTGESPTLTEEEKLKLYRAVKDRVGSRAKIIAGTGSNCTGSSARLSFKAAEAGVDGIMLVVPYYNKPSQEGLYQHFQVVASAVEDLPVMLYNVPSRTGGSLELGTILKLSRIPNIVALKEAGGELNQAAGVKMGTQDFTLYSGNDDQTLALLALGGGGVVSVCSHIIGPQILQMMDLFFAGQVREAFDLHQRLLPLFQGLFMATNPLPIKAALKLMGWDTGGHRLPLAALDPEQEASLQKLLEDYGLI